LHHAGIDTCGDAVMKRMNELFTDPMQDVY
jgi:hypothetical protein